MKILVADDDALNRKYLCTLLTLERHTVVECEDGLDSLSYLEQNPCDAVISDVLMPRMDGYRLCYEIRKNEKLRATPIILYTASYLSDADEKAALAMGADRFIRKPAVPELIVKTLHELIATRPAFNDVSPHEPTESSALREYSEALVRKLEETNAQLAAANEALRESEERLRLAASAGNVGIWEWDPASDRLVWSDQQKIAFGWQPNSRDLTLQILLNAIHSEDRQRVEESFHSALAQCTGYEAEYRVVWLDGSVHWIADKGRGDYDATGRCLRMRGITLDITRRKETDEALRKSEARFRDMADSAPVMIWITRADGFCIYLNKQWKDFTGQSDTSGLGFGWLDAVYPEDRERTSEEFRKAMERRDELRMEYRLRRHDGTFRWVIDSGLPRISQSGEFFGFIGSAIDITDRKLAEEERQSVLERIRFLHEIGLAINSSLDLQTILETLLEKIDLFIPYPSATAVRLLNKETGQLEALACHNLDAAEWKRYFNVTPVGRAKCVLESKTPVIVRNLLTDSETANPSIYRRLGVVSLIGVPLIIEGEALGILNFFTKEEREFTFEEIEFLMTLAGQAAVAMHNARLYDENERRRREAEELAGIARSLTETLDLKAIGERVVSSVVKLFGVKGATVRLRESDGSLRSFAATGEVFSQTPAGAVVPAGAGLASRAFTEEQPVWSADMLNDPSIRLSDRMREYLSQSGDGSMIAVPLRAHDNLIGVLSLGDRTGRNYLGSEVALLQTFVYQLALAIQNALLYEQGQIHLKRIEALRQIDRAITSTLDLHSVLHLLLEKIDVFLPYPAATTIRLFNGATRKFDNTACRNIDEREWRARIGQGSGNLSEQVLKTKRPVIVPNIQEDAQRSASLFYREYGFVSYLGVPLLAKDEVVGILGFYTRSPHNFTAEETDALLTLAGQAAIAINNAQLYQEIDRSKKELETTNRSLETSLKKLDSLYAGLSPISTTLSTQELMSGIINRIIEATGADAALIRIRDDKDGSLPIVGHYGFSDEYLTRVAKAPTIGAVSWVIEHGEPIIAPDITTEARLTSKVQVQLGLRSCAMLPINVYGEVHGILHVASSVLGHFDEEQRNHLVAITRQMSIAMENRELFDRVKASRDDVERANTALTERNRMLSALHTVAAASSQSLNLDHVLNSAIQKITDIFHFDATQIHIHDKQLDELGLKASFANDPRFSVAQSFKMGQGILGNVAQSGEKLIFADIQSDPQYQELSRIKTSGRHGYHFFAIFPMRGKARNLGTIACVGAERRELAASEVQLLEAISDQLAVAIENSELYEDLRIKVEELQCKTTELEQANKVKDDFLGVVSHELRTPINVIMGYTSLFKDGFFGDVKPKQEDALAKIARESKDLLVMINSVLHATALETEWARLETEEFSVASLLEELRANYAVTAPQQLNLYWNYPTNSPPLRTDCRMLKQILDNLIGNAVKFTEQGMVTITARVGSKDLSCEGAGNISESAPLCPQSTLFEFEVADTGVGIPSERLGKIFDKFYQVDSSETRRFGGVGIGLYIAKKFAELLGGRITVESREGSGSKFTLTVPCELGAENYSESTTHPPATP